MKLSFLFLMICLIPELVAATVPEPVWPTWVGVSKGADPAAPDKGIDQDDHSNFDHGSDSWGWWANAEVTSGGVVVATVEMRYIPIQAADYGKGPLAGIYKMGAPVNEQGARPHEFPRQVVPAGDLNSNKAFWISAEEVSQDVWEKVMGVVLKKKLEDNSDINDIDTVSTADLKTLRAVDSQTLPNVKQFCSDFQSLANVSSNVRLPTEKEWEYVCRAGTATAFWTGRLLDGVLDSAFSGASVSHSGMMYDYDADDMLAKAGTAPNGDGGLTPPWDFNVSSVDGNGVASYNGNRGVKIRIGGKLILSGGELNLEVASLFDDRYQHRYKADHYGTHTPILMLYYYDGTEFIPRPYADPTAANMYYRFLELSDPTDRNNPADYIPTSDLTLDTGRQRHYISGLFYKHTVKDVDKNDTLAKMDVYSYHVGTEPGDWYMSPYDPEYLRKYAISNSLSKGTPLAKIPPQGKQLEYREMVHVTTRFNASGVEVEDGNYIKDFDGTLHPIRSMYTPTPYWSDGQKRFETLPTTNIDIASIARQVDLNAPGDPDMNTDEYVEEVTSTLDDYWGGRGNIPNTFYTGPYTGIVEFAGLGGVRSSIVDEIQVEMGSPSVKVTVGGLGRNPWGLYNIHGNVEEWVNTRWDGESDYSDPAKYDTGTFYITRGGSWRTGADRCRSAARTARHPDQGYDDVGFRIIIE